MYIAAGHRLSSISGKREVYSWGSPEGYTVSVENDWLFVCNVHQFDR